MVSYQTTSRQITVRRLVTSSIDRVQNKEIDSRYLCHQYRRWVDVDVDAERTDRVKVGSSLGASIPAWQGLPYP